MTEAEWIASTNPADLFRCAITVSGHRKYRLYLCGGCREIKHLFYDDNSLDAVEVAERYVDGLANDEELRSAAWHAEVPTFGYHFDEEFVRPHLAVYQDMISRMIESGVLDGVFLETGEWKIDDTIASKLKTAACIAEHTLLSPSDTLVRWIESLQSHGWPGRWLIDCIFGNPFQSTMMDQEWLINHPGIQRTALELYNTRQFDELPMLADALEDAGFADAELLKHCRSHQKHARGCWALDRLLERD